MMKISFLLACGYANNVSLFQEDENLNIFQRLFYSNADEYEETFNDFEPKFQGITNLLHHHNHHGHYRVYKPHHVTYKLYPISFGSWHANKITQGQSIFSVE